MYYVHLRLRYVPDKEWKSEEIIKCCRLIRITNEKIATSDSLSISALNSQEYLLEALSTKWKTGNAETSGNSDACTPLLL